MRRGFEQENLYTLSKHATEFKNKVNNLQILNHFCDDRILPNLMLSYVSIPKIITVKLNLSFSLIQGKSLD